jgi:ATP-dependent RNA helicase SUPV3L1/SUV3
VLLADEQLTGGSRDRVQHRVDRFVAHSIETQLKPLTDLQQAEQLQGFAKGLAFRLVENGGLVERKSVAEEMKSLDQTARAALRRLGVRFGFYNVFLPALIKPAPAEVLTLLWSLKHDLMDAHGRAEPVQLLAAGRTSFVPDAAIDAVFYRLAGFAVLGPRAVRFDILERLADQIRPALFWKEGVEVRPDAAFGKGAFFVTPGMMSILGATHDDMAAVLGGLGYRGQPMTKAEFDVKLEAVKAIVPAQAAAAPEAPKFEVVIATPHRIELPAPDAAATEQSAEETAKATGTETGTEDVSTVVATADEDMAEAVPASAPTVQADAADASAEEAKPVLIWRVARAERPERPQFNRGQRRDGADSTAPREGKPKFDRSRFQRPPGQPAPEGEGDKRDGARRERNERGDGGKPRFDGKRGRDGEEGARPRFDKPSGGKPSFDKPKFDKPKAEKPIDPDSPFAKLAALKERMKG